MTRPHAAQPPAKRHAHIATKVLVSPIGLVGLLILVATSFVSQPSTAIIIVSNVRDSTTSSGQVGVNGAGICFRSNAAAEWQCQRASFGTYGYDNLPVYAARIAFSLGVFRFMFNNLAIAYALALALFFILLVVAAGIAHHSGESYHHKHMHIYRPLILKALSYLNAFSTGIACMAAVNSWQMSQSCTYLQRADSSLQFAISSGFYITIVGFLIHLFSLILTFILAAKSRIHLRDPAMILLALANNHRARRRIHGSDSTAQAGSEKPSLSFSGLPSVKSHDWVVKNLGSTVSAEAEPRPEEDQFVAGSQVSQHSLVTEPFQTVGQQKKETSAGSSNLELPPVRSTNSSKKQPPDRSIQSVAPLKISSKRSMSKSQASRTASTLVPPPYTPVADSPLESDFAAGTHSEFSPTKRVRA